MSLTVENIISRNKPMCEYTTQHIGALHLYEMLGDYVVLYRPNLNNVDLIVLTLTGSFPHAAGVYEAVEKQMKEVEKGMNFISQELRTHIAKTSGGYAYRQVADASGYRTASNYGNVIQGMDDVIAPIIEEYLTQE
jgi:hypothetical protein|nr:MAG TPA: hypothetical protein [Caudoviricetes sp.]